MEIQTSKGEAPRAPKPPPPEPPGVEAGGWWFAADGLTPDTAPGYWALRMLDASKRAYEDDGPFDGARPFHRFKHGTTQAFGWEEGGYLCLAFRGTKAMPRDALIDVAAYLQGSPPTHWGFGHAWRTIERDVMMWLALWPQAERPPLLVTGHSLGGAMAVIAALDLAPTNRIAGVFTYGAPRAGSAEFAAAYASRPCGDGRTLGEVTWRITHAGDPVPIVPPPLLFRHVGRHLELRTPQTFVLPTGGVLAQGAALPVKAEAGFLNEVAPLLQGSVGAQVLGVDAAIFARSPLIALILTVLGFGLLLLSDRWTGFEAGFARAAASPWLLWPMAGVSLVAFQQLTYLVPKIPVWLRWIAGAGLFWLALTYVWPLLVGVQAAGLVVLGLTLLIRLALPAVPDHMLDGYVASLFPYRLSLKLSGAPGS